MAFDSLAEQELKPGKIVKVQLHQLRGAPILHVEHAGDTNPGYMSELVLDARGQLEIGEGGADYDAAREAEILKRLRVRFARHVVRHIERVFHDDGSPATDADIPEFVAKMPRHAFMALVRFCRNPLNWVDGGGPAAKPDAVAAK